ncbi:MAG: cysteine dioxygenase family protein [Bacteroidetes bacterium]|jgi:hypothetical protein|nr:cysteine dioxygenase family protein [Bacteroidota bacterium]MBT6687559.1 cysteine dioxygenase family protein [Bacteroidota bacterium]MBT7142790.1 cysteine dioxygenase family protein [Bacteroidota bacterium]MBT7491993.1 cysteine dioxygenase family protein [Bacteroidota bacterium]
MNKELPNCIKEISAELNNLPFINNELVSEIVSEANLSEKELREYISFDHCISESYGRKLIVDNGNYKILLMSWRVGDFTAIHNHGYTEWGCVYFFGEAAHRLYETNEKEIKLIQKDNFYEGQIASVCGDLTHMMGNSFSKKLTTLHIYGSNTRKNNVSENAKVYMPEFQKEVTTKGSAYLNMNKKLMLSDKPLLNISLDDFIDYFTLVRPFYELSKKYNVISKMEEQIAKLN